MREKRLERHMKQACEFALIFATGYVAMEWDAQAGDKYGVDPETGKISHTGDLKVEALTPVDVIVDIFKETSKKDWIVLRRWENKYDKIAKHPDLKDEILEVATKDDQVNRLNYSVTTSNFPTDDIPVYTFMHEKTPALPDGRMMILSNDKTVYYDGPLPYRKVPVYRIAPGEFYGSPYGYTQAFDLLAIQEALNSLYSSAVTNNMTFATQNITVPRGSNINVTQLHGGLNLIEHDPKLGKPEPLQLTASAPELYRLIEMLEAKHETLAGINSVVRGNPEASLKSGAALALVAAQAIQFNSGLQGQYVELVEDLGTGLIEILQDYAKAPRLAMIAGKSARPFMKEFTGDDISDISRVTVEMGSAVSRTLAGKVERANNLLQAGLIKTPEEYIMVEQTGKLEPMIEGQTSQLLLIKSENERLREGDQIQAVVTEDHRLHIMEHGSVLSNPVTKEQPEVVAAVTEHIQQHLELLRTTDPQLLQLLGQQPLPPLQPPAGAPAMGAEQPNQGQLDQLSGNPEVLSQDISGDMPDMPNMPNNPLTGETYDTESGGLPQ